jgi:hypothetical protein
MDASLNVLSRKVDLVVETDNEVWICETKIRLSPEAVGQVLTYAKLYAQTYPLEGKPLRMAIICSMDDLGVRQVAEAQGITIFKV